MIISTFDRACHAEPDKRELELSADRSFLASRQNYYSVDLRAAKREADTRRLSKSHRHLPKAVQSGRAKPTLRSDSASGRASPRYESRHPSRGYVTPGTQN